MKPTLQFDLILVLCNYLLWPAKAAVIILCRNLTNVEENLFCHIRAQWTHLSQCIYWYNNSQTLLRIKIVLVKRDILEIKLLFHTFYVRMKI